MVETQVANSSTAQKQDPRWSRPSAHIPGAPIVSIIGDGQLARMMHHAGIELGLSMRILTSSPDSSAAQVTPNILYGDYTVREDVCAASVGAHAVTFDHEHVPNTYLEALISQGVNVQPQPQALVYAQDKLLMRQKLREIGAPIPPFMDILSAQHMREFFHATGGHVCLKTRRGGYDGKGVWFPSTEEEAAQRAGELLAAGHTLLAEKKVPLVRELSAMVARTPSGEMAAWPVVESVQENGICVEAVAPAPATTPAVCAAAQELAQMIARELGVTGVLAVELFETIDEAGQPDIVVNELAMRPHNTGHWTQDGCITSQFEQHLRAVLNRPLGSAEPIAGTTVMANVLGADVDPDMPMHQRMDEVWRRFPHAKIHMYGKQWRPRRKMGHVNMVQLPGESVEHVRSAARSAAQFLATAGWATL